MWLISLILLVVVVFDAISDAKLDQSGKRQHIMEAVSILGLFAVIFIQGVTPQPFWKILLVYGLLRKMFFNLTYNLTRGLPIGFIGDTDPLFDKWYKKIPLWAQLSLDVLALFLFIILNV